MSNLFNIIYVKYVIYKAAYSVEVLDMLIYLTTDGM